MRPGNSGGAIIDDTGALTGVVVAGYDPLKMFVKTGYSAVLINLGVWADNALLLLPAGWSQADPPPVFHDRAEAIKNLQAATVEVLLFKADQAIPPAIMASNLAGQSGLPPASAPRTDPQGQKEPVLARAREADRRMTEVYAALRSRLNAAGKAQLKDAQLIWLKSRTTQTGSAELLAKGAAAAPDSLRRFAEMDEARTAALLTVLQSLR